VPLRLINLKKRGELRRGVNYIKRQSNCVDRVSLQSDNRIQISPQKRETNQLSLLPVLRELPLCSNPQLRIPHHECYLYPHIQNDVTKSKPTQIEV
jgi:hypothetical protein